jgi:sugar lactone lactonase YvrE
MTDKADLVLKTEATLGEGPVWDCKTSQLYWVDIVNKIVNCYDPKLAKNSTFDIGQDVSCIVPRESSGFILGVREGIASVDANIDDFKIVVEKKAEGIRFNDGKCDPAGRFWAGTIADDVKEGTASLYCLNTDLHLDLKIPKVTISNGLAWTADHKKLYYIDTPTRQVVSYDYDIADGNIENKKVIIEIDQQMGFPDGMTIDEKGILYVAMWEGGKVVRINPITGVLLDSIEVPGANLVTSCTFGGVNLDELYITTARLGLSDSDLKEQSNAGSLFKVCPGAKGLPAFAFRG